MAKLISKGGKGSGNWGHAGRPGKVGGSAPRGGGSGAAVNDNTTPYERLGDQRQNIDFAAAPWRFDGGDGRMKQLLMRKVADIVEAQTSGFNLSVVAHNKTIKRLMDRYALPRYVPHGVISAWAHTSNGTSDSLYIQYRAAKLFHDKFGTKLSSWQRDFASVFDIDMDSENLDAEFADAQLITPDHTNQEIDNILVGMYNDTQDMLRAAGIDRVTLYRGVSVPDGTQAGNGKIITMDDSNALESWTTDKDVAETFARMHNGVVVRSTFPAERVLSTPLTGIGQAGELEVVVIGSDISNGEPYPDMGVVVWDGENNGKTNQ